MQLSCHCGQVQLTLAMPPETLTSCNCSICSRYGALWGYFDPKDVSLNERTDSATAGYSHGDKYLLFYHCKTCGCVTHTLTTDKVSEPRIALNFRMAPQALRENIQIRHFDGADTWQYLD
ncbi:aldehyde-activating protein [Shewanella insulae]|uniref:GFA family protein n=1 Tax=Shewanella insulae TaxID=2681496 RepID=UPI001EFEEC26|nr:aldehyde-activating protein [Shewanella insulae]MCG9738435.1 aldehyde-activating protein [Shewanella insulae]